MENKLLYVYLVGLGYVANINNFIIFKSIYHYLYSLWNNNFFDCFKTKTLFSRYFSITVNILKENRKYIIG